MPPDADDRRPPGRKSGDHDDAHGDGNAKDSVYGLHVFPQHAKLLAASAISPGLARARGYVSVDTRKQLQRYDRNFGGKCPIPGLLIPLRRKDGSVWGYQYRPDEPRNGDGKPRKYETPWQQRNGIDIPAGIAAQLDDPSIPLLVTEGTRKADAAMSHGLVCVSLLGVWSWLGRNTVHGKVALPEWRDIALNGRRVILGYDHDVTRKPGPQAALREIAAYLETKGAAVEYLHLPDLGDGKTGLDDYLAAEGADGIWALVRPELPALAPPTADSAPPTPSADASHLHTPPPWASDQDILARMVCEAGVWCGFTGEHRNAKLTYLAITSRVLDDPVSIAVKGLSSSGKSYTVGTVLKFFPDEAVITMTAMSERALVYMEDDFAHRTLVLFEAVALREEREKTESNLTAYIVRSLLSEGEIRYPVAARDEGGKMVTRWIVKKGPTNFIVTTTAASLHGENETRMLSLPTDDSAAQTSAIMASIAAGRRDDADFSEWHAYARWIAAGNHEAAIPYAEWLASQIPPIAVRLRRDFRALLRLIQAHAILHQLNRATDEQGRIVATEADYLAVRALVADLVSDAVGATVRPATRDTVEAVVKLDQGQGVKVHDLAAHLDLERSTVQYRVSAARERGYLVNLEDKRGKPARYQAGSPLPQEVVILPERIEGVNPHPAPAHHTPDDAAPQVSEGVNAGCEGVNQPRGGEAQTGPCARCRRPCNRYGDGGRPLCDDCSETQP